MTVPNHYLWLYNDKTLLYMSKWVWEVGRVREEARPIKQICFRLTLVLSCAMKFESYPHDIQVCSMMIESCEWFFFNFRNDSQINHIFAVSHTVHDLVFIWNMTDPLVVNDEIELPQLDISNNYTMDCTIPYSTGKPFVLIPSFNLMLLFPSRKLYMPGCSV